MFLSEDQENSAGQLLSNPSDNPGFYTRSEAEYENNSEAFLLKERNFQRQYAHIYASRLWMLRGKVETAAHNRWGKDTLWCSIRELTVSDALFSQTALKGEVGKNKQKDQEVAKI